MDKKEIFLEESIVDDLSQDLGMIERPLSGNVFAVFGWVLVLIIVLALLRLTWLQVFLGPSYQSRALANAGQETILKAPRGIIYDRNGNILVSNQPNFSVVLNLSELLKNRNSLDDTLNQINNVAPFDVSSAKQEIASVDLETQAYLPIIQDVSLSEVIALKKLNLKPVIIENSYKRQYLEGPIFSHVVGYTGLVSQSDLNNNKDLSLNDEIGKSGIESEYNSYLTGTNGVEISYKDAKGNVLENKTLNNPVGGDSVNLTIDANLQDYFYKAMQDQLASLGKVAGAGLVMNPQTGEILSMVSLPSFDNNNLTGQIFVDKNKPTFNRIISGLYSPGSTIKPLVSFGILEDNIINPLKKILSIGYIEVPNPYYPDKPSKFLDWRPQGWVDLYSALARSSNVYFYEVVGGFTDKSPDAKFGGGTQVGLGINRLIDYWKKFKIDLPTGVDLPGESAGVLANPQEREKETGNPWRLGDTYNVAIGQGDLRITPIELLRYICSIADKGKMPVPYLASDIVDAQGNVVYKKVPSFDIISANDPNHFNEIEQGMLDGVTKDYGTSHTLVDIPMRIAAKTGSAQIQNNQKTNAFFVGYNIPPTSSDSNSNLTNSTSSLNNSGQQISSNTPQQIAVLVMIEDAKEGSLNAVPVAKKVFQWYYDNRIIKK